MQMANLNKAGPGNAVVTVRLSGKFAFMVCRTPEETTAAMGLNGIPFHGQMLKVERPSNFPGPRENTASWQALAAALRA